MINNNIPAPVEATRSVPEGVVAERYTPPVGKGRTIIQSYRRMFGTVGYQVRKVFDPLAARNIEFTTVDDRTLTFGGAMAVKGGVGAVLAGFSVAEALVGGAGYCAGKVSGNQQLEKGSRKLLRQAQRGVETSIVLVAGGINNTVVGGLGLALSGLFVALTPVGLGAWAVFRARNGMPPYFTQEERQRAAQDTEEIRFVEEQSAREYCEQHLYFMLEDIAVASYKTPGTRGYNITLLTTEQIEDRKYEQLRGMLCYCHNTQANREFFYGDMARDNSFAIENVRLGESLFSSTLPFVCAKVDKKHKEILYWLPKVDVQATMPTEPLIAEVVVENRNQEDTMQQEADLRVTRVFETAEKEEEEGRWQETRIQANGSITIQPMQHVRLSEGRQIV